METRQRPPAPGAPQEEKRGANVEVYGFVAWIATGLTFGTALPYPTLNKSTLEISQLIEVDHSGLCVVGVPVRGVARVARSDLLPLQARLPTPALCFRCVVCVSHVSDWAIARTYILAVL